MPERNHRPAFYGWRLLAALCAIQIAAVSFPMYGGAVLNSMMARELAFDATSLGLPIAVFMLVIGFAAPLVAWAIGRMGARWVIVCGCVTIAVGALGIAQLVRTPVSATLLYGAVVGGGVALGGVLASQTLATRWFIARRTLAISMLVSTISVGGFLAPPLLEYFGSSQASGWRAAWMMVAAIALAAALLGWLVIRDAPEDMGQQPLGHAAPEALPLHRKTARDFTPREAVRSAAFWAIVLGTNIFSGTFALVLSHGIPHVLQGGHGTMAAAMTISLIMAASLAVKLGTGLIGDRHDPRLIWSGALVVSAGGLLLAAYGKGWSLLYAYPIATGVGVGVAPVCMMALLADYFGRKHFPALSSGVIAAQTLTGFVTPIAAGRIFEGTGSYTIAFTGMAALALCAALALALVRAPNGKPGPKSSIGR